MQTSQASALAALVLLEMLGGCGKDPPRSAEGPSGTYRYMLQLAPGGVRAGTLVVDGKDAGRFVEGQGFVDLPHTTWLGDTRLGLRVETTCGPQELTLDVTLSRAVEIERRKRSQVITGARRVDGVVVKAPELAAAVVYLDARTGPPTDVTIGTQVLPAAKTGKVVVQIGSCTEARAITIGGQAAGELAPAGKASLVDVPGGQCVRLEALRFVTPGMATAGEPTVEVLKGRRTYAVPLEITYFFTPPPTSIDGRGDVGRSLWAAAACR